MSVAHLAEVRAAELRQLDEPPVVPVADYAAVREALFQVQRATQSVLDADVRAAQQAVADIAREYPVMRTLVGYLVAEGERDLRAAVAEALAELRGVADERLSPHSQVPERLETHRDEVLDLSARAKDLLPDVMALAASAGAWQGQAAEGYRETSSQQGAAWEEFIQIVGSSAESLDEAAALHRATFFLCAESLRAAAREIELLAVGDPAHLFARTRQAIAKVGQATAQLTRDVDGAQRGQSAVELAQRMEDALGGAEILTEPTWPSDGPDGG